MNIRRRPPNPSVKVANLEYAIPHSDGAPQNILEKIVWQKDREISLAKKLLPFEELKSQVSRMPRPRSFIKALRETSKFPAVIAEVKKASPSKGLIREDFDPFSISQAYQEGGAACLSVLTDKVFFQGGFEVLSAVRKTVNLPLLCKDFILSPYQIYQARGSGADAVLLIASILSDQDLVYLRKIANSLGMTILVEVHNSKELDRVMKLGEFPLIGINNRDLKTFKTDLSITKELLNKYRVECEKKEILIVSESGIFTRKDLDEVYSYGADAVLVGESLMRQKNIKSGLNKLING
tara:strand:- start:24548 stop:25432 length:885 start_codon:yes stop_codon:yes gene_type:complete